MVRHFIRPAEEAALTLADVDRLVATHREQGCFLSTSPGRLLTHAGSATMLVSILLQHARFGLLVREFAEANPAMSADTATAMAEARLLRER